MPVVSRLRLLFGPVSLLTVGLVLSAAGCSPRTDTGAPRATPQQSVLRVGTGRMEIYTEAGLGQRRFGVDAARVWAVLPGVFETLDIPLTVRDQSTLQVGNEGYSARRVEGKRLSTYLDCGTNFNGVLADVYDVTLQIIVTLESKPEDTVVHVGVDALAESRSTSGNPIHCKSKGTLETRFTDLVAEALVAGAP